MIEVVNSQIEEPIPSAKGIKTAPLVITLSKIVRKTNVSNSKEKILDIKA